MEKPFDVERMIRNKFGGKVPGWVISFFRRLLHEDYMNAFLVQGVTGVDAAVGSLDYMGVTLHVEGLENIPTEGRYTVASTHPMGGHDAIGVLAIFGKHFGGNVKIPVNDLLMGVKALESVFLPVNKVGGQSRALAESLDAVFRSDVQMLIFPAGACARKKKGKITELPWTKTFITKSVETHRDIIPVHFEGRNSWRFYFLDWIGRVTGINKKFSLAMILLIDEMYRARGSSYTVKVGKPIPWQTFDRSKTALEWAETLRETTLNL